MRRQSLGVNQKYKLPTVEVGGDLPNNSLVGIQQKCRASSGSNGSSGTPAFAGIGSAANKVVAGTTTGSSGLTSVSDATANVAATFKTASQNVVSAFCTPKRLTSKTLQVTASHLKMPWMISSSGGDGDATASGSTGAAASAALEIGAKDDGSIGRGSLRGSVPSATGGSNRALMLQRSNTIDASQRILNTASRAQALLGKNQNKNDNDELGGDSDHGRVRASARRGNRDMDRLMHTGLATPRRTSRRSIVMDSSNSSRPTLAQQHPAVKSTTPTPVRRVRRSKTLSDVDHVLCTPKRSSRKVQLSKASLPARAKSESYTKKKVLPASLANLDDDKMDADASTTSASTLTTNDTPTPAQIIDITSKDTPDPSPIVLSTAPWTCTCGEKDNGGDCPFCGMCGSKQRWECADCSYASNKCKFKFCAMCGTVKHAKE